ncbi:hypothetical protein [Vibrio parahaemolyticus]|uniref:hypothetical protein n=1 Tax=Vibrio parahaemolyticus TaxID=670 RepID=UPI002B1FA93E|nr:hypothetical protein [Vibrio parahaemolyticus]MEA5377620.1 hypothetical protein [Vibrio parahaemolyticus]
MKIDENGNFIEDTTNWIYVGADINKLDWSKIGKTKNELATRSTSSQNHTRLLHYSTGNESEWFICKPDEMKNAVMYLVQENFGSSVYYDNSSFHMEPVYYSCGYELEQYFRGVAPLPNQVAPQVSRNFVTQNSMVNDSFEGDEENSGFDANHPDFINDYKIQSLYLKR